MKFSEGGRAKRRGLSQAPTDTPSPGLNPPTGGRLSVFHTSAPDGKGEGKYTTERVTAKRKGLLHSQHFFLFYCASEKNKKSSVGITAYSITEPFILL